MSGTNRDVPGIPWRAGPSIAGREVTTRLRTFRKHHRPCGQPVAVGEIERFRPVPPQAGHFKRIKATPSDLPFKSTGFAMYPVPPQFGQSSGLTPLPLSVDGILPDFRHHLCSNRFCVTNHEQDRKLDRNRRAKWQIEARRGGCQDAISCKRRISDFGVGRSAAASVAR